MPRAPRKLITANGRPQIPIDWEKVDMFLEAGCNGLEIAANFNMHHNNFYDRVALEKGIGFIEYKHQKLAKGNSLLRAVQYKIAAKGDKAMLIWLGKQRLEQRDDPKGSKEFDGTLVSVLEALKKIKDEKDFETTIDVAVVENPADNIGSGEKNA